MTKYIDSQLTKLDLGFKEKLALWLLKGWLQQREKNMNINLKNWTVADYAKLIATVAASFAVGFSQGGYLPGVITAVAALAGALQTPPGHDSVPK